jgi:hypothetical protein
LTSTQTKTSSAGQKNKQAPQAMTISSSPSRQWSPTVAKTTTASNGPAAVPKTRSDCFRTYNLLREPEGIESPKIASTADDCEPTKQPMIAVDAQMHKNCLFASIWSPSTTDATNEQKPNAPMITAVRITAVRDHRSASHAAGNAAQRFATPMAPTA